VTTSQPFEFFFILHQFSLSELDFTTKEEGESTPFTFLVVRVNIEDQPYVFHIQNVTWENQHVVWKNFIQKGARGRSPQKMF